MSKCALSNLENRIFFSNQSDDAYLMTPTITKHGMNLYCGSGPIFTGSVLADPDPDSRIQILGVDIGIGPQVRSGRRKLILLYNIFVLRIANINNNCSVKTCDE